MASYPELNYEFDKTMPKKLRGYCDGNIILLNPDQHETEVPGTLAEEIAHYLTSVGDITEQKNAVERKQEQQARDLGAVFVVTPSDILSCYKANLTTYWECAEFLGITVNTLKRAVSVYAKKNDGKLKYNHYTFYFEPNGTIKVVDWFK